MKRLFLILCFLAACARDSAHENAQEAVLPDSAGWRHASFENLSFRYPVSRVRSVIDRRSEDCTQRGFPYVEGWDSTVDGALIVSYAPADLDAVADAHGFERRPDGPAEWKCVGRGACVMRPWQMKQGNDWAGLDFADSLDVGPWRALTGTMTTLGYFTEFPDSLRTPDDDPNATLPKETLYQVTFFAFAPLSSRCAAVISWRGEPVSEYAGGEAAAAWDTALIRHMLSTAVLGRRENR